MVGFYAAVDTCPADVLLQRLGRLHRHRSGTTPEAWLVDPGDLDSFIDQRGRARGAEGQGWAWVYQNILSVSETLSFVSECGGITVPDDCRQLIERATHADHLRALAERRGGKWENLWRNLYSSEAQQAALGDAGVIRWDEDYAAALCDERQVTRLGDGTIDVDISGLTSPFDGARIWRISVPGRWLHSVAIGTTGQCEGQTIAIGDVVMTYTEEGLALA